MQQIRLRFVTLPQFVKSESCFGWGVCESFPFFFFLQSNPFQMQGTKVVCLHLQLDKLGHEENTDERQGMMAVRDSLLTEFT